LNKGFAFTVVISALIFTIGFSKISTAQVQIELEEISSDFARPVFLTHAGDGLGRLFVVEQEGRVRIIENGEILESPFINIQPRVGFGNERGLLSIAFHPDYATNGRVFADYTNTNGDTIVSEFAVSDSDPNMVDPESETILLQVVQPTAIHNGGQLHFGPDGMLYISMGDGGGPIDPDGNGQNKENLLGAVLRIDIDSEFPFAVPADNPFVDEDGRDEIWAYGLRNPWRFSFDQLTGKLFLGDVGEGRFEEVDLIVRGGNYGWNTMEGNACFNPRVGCDPSGLVRPIAEFVQTAENDFRGAVIGGYVYRGSQFPDLFGLYFFGDLNSGRIWSLEEITEENYLMREVLDTDMLITSFGEDEDGELYVMNLAGQVFRIISVTENEGEGESTEAESEGGEGEGGSKQEGNVEDEAEGEGEREEGETNGETTPVSCTGVTVARDTSLMKTLQPLRFVRDTLLQDSTVGERTIQIFYSR